MQHQKEKQTFGLFTIDKSLKAKSDV